MDFLKIDTSSPETIEKSFKTIAETLLKDFKIKVNDQFYRLLDIEFYYSHEGKFVDPYIHGNELQKETGRWYFHESGIDITIGSNGNYGGILIRGIGKLAKEATENTIEEEIHGPLKVMKELMTNLRAVNDDLLNEFCLARMNAEKDTDNSKRFILTSNRIGLKLHQNDSDGFLNKEYRFIAAFTENGNNKFKDKDRIVKAAFKKGIVEEEAARKILGYNTDFAK